ncbi:hypothetical protein N7468_003236 [Penicillium chermesinum]|uniref:TLC domain-containing protein n=1 Tax=Penicillium chermesinum TaxID=63820 RepID=A0A9W9P8X4_9EURO|nr:uncharacterized protein N7468_003236 [Penicillium chermesinum]KAJ5238617.1 hypothetical protein N7468_003236 [Penicillium chermesinum]
MPAQHTSAQSNGASRRRKEPPNSHLGHVRKASIAHANKRRKSRSLWRRATKRAIQHTWLIPLILILAFVSLYAINPTEDNIVHHFLFLSYEQPPAVPGGPVQYGKGLYDIAFVIFYSIVLSFTREFIMQELLGPLSRSCGIKSKRKQARFMEQMYTAIYFGIMGPAGLYVMRQSPVWYFNTAGIFYYLFEAAYWAQQALVMILGQEERRKDFKELVAHHIVTLSLIALSYRFHFTYIGVAIYTTHDLSDFFLALSKSLHYLDSELLVPFYAFSVISWIYLRHYLNLHVLWSILTEFKTVGPFELNWETQQYKCWISQVITFSLLAMLQSLNLFWLYCLLRSALKALLTGEKKDDRSDDSEPEMTVNDAPGKEVGKP